MCFPVSEYPLSKVLFGPGTERISHVINLPRTKTIISGRKTLITNRHIILPISQQVLNFPVLLLIMLLQHLHIHRQLVNSRSQSLIVHPQTMIVALELVVVSQHHPQLFLDAMQAQHPLLVDDGTVDVDRDLVWHFVGHWDLYLLLYDFLHWVVYIHRLVDVDWLVDVHWLLHLDVHWLLDDLWWACYLNLHRHFLLHFYDLFYDSLRPLDVLRHLNSHLHWFLHHDLLDCFFRSSSVLVFQLFF
jgi:hypothetical protein